MEIDNQPEEELDLSNPEVVTKYRVASDIANEALQEVLKNIAVGRRIADLCQLGDDFITERTSKIYSKGKIERGIAFPTCISSNNCLGHFSPLTNDPAVLNHGDVVKIDLGCHIDGHIAVVAHTVVLETPDVTVNDRRADAIAAANTAADVVLRLIRPGNKSGEITTAIQKVADQFRCQPVEGVLSHQMKRFVIDGNQVILNKQSPEQKIADFEFKEHEVYQIDIVMSTGEGKGRETESRTTVFKRTLDQNYLLKLKASRYVFNEINNRFPTMPFTLRSLDEKKGRLGIVELLNHDLVQPYPVLFEREGEFVAQIKFTVLLLPAGPLRSTGIPVQANVHSTCSISDPEIIGLLNTSAKRKNKKKKKKSGAAAKDQPGDMEAEGGADSMDTN